MPAINENYLFDKEKYQSSLKNAFSDLTQC